MSPSNPNSAPSVFDPVKELTIGSEKITLRELSWPHALKFLQMLSKNAGEFLKVDKAGKTEFDLAKLSDMIVSAGELSTYLILHATGKDQAWLDKLSFAAGCEVLDAALTLNLSPEIFGKAKKAVGRFAQALGVNGKNAEPGRTPTSPPASTS